jgi:hypothetical protein
MWNHKLAHLMNFYLCIGFAPQVKEVHKGAQVERYDKMLAVVKRQHSSGVLLRDTGIQSLLVPERRIFTVLQILSS